MLIGIVGAMDCEIEELKNDIINIEEIKIDEFTFYQGKLHDRDIVLTKSGVGKVNATIVTTILIKVFNVDKIIFTGVAGAVNENVKIADIVVGTELIHTDFYVPGYKYGVISGLKNSYFKADENLFNIAKESAIKLFGKEKVFTGRISTRDEFVDKIETLNFLREEFDAYCTEMEGAALAQTCTLLNVPFVVIRSMSDSADHNSSMDFDEFVHIAAKNSKLIVEEILKHKEV